MWYTLLCVAITFKASQAAWQFEEYSQFHELSCYKNECNFTMDLRPTTDHGWYPVLVRVNLGHTLKIDEGMVEVYDVKKDINGEPAVMINQRNVWKGSILAMQRRYGQTIACEFDSGCLLDCCVARGWATIKKDYNQDDKPEIRVEWEPMISFTQLWFGPRIKFSYEIIDGVVGDLKVDPWIHYWGHCHEPNAPWADSDYGVKVPLTYKN